MKNTGARQASIPRRRAYGVAEAAQLYSVSRGFLWKRIQDGALPVKRAGRRVLILHANLVAFFEGDDKRTEP
jgi:excisionase family DNA binding protein